MKEILPNADGSLDITFDNCETPVQMGYSALGIATFLDGEGKLIDGIYLGIPNDNYPLNCMMLNFLVTQLEEKNSISFLIQK